MKKLDDKIVIKEQEIKAKELGTSGRNNNTNNDSSCDCCCSNVIASETVTEQEQGFDQEHHGKDNKLHEMIYGHLLVRILEYTHHNRLVEVAYVL